MDYNHNKPPLVDPIPVTLGTPPSKLTVACVWYGTMYDRIYLERLRNMLQRHLHIPYELVCITAREDLPEGIRAIPPTIPPELCDGTDVVGNSIGWWAKIDLFRPGLFGYDERILFFDLDLVFTDVIDKFAYAQDPFCILPNFEPMREFSAHNSSIMLWTPSEKTEKIYTEFSPEVVETLHGDQCWIWRVLGDDNIRNYPKDWAVSYTYMQKIVSSWQPTENTCVIVFHARPKPHEVNDKIIVENWK